MRHIIIAFLISVCFNFDTIAQIDFEDRSSTEKSSATIPYTGQFEKLNYSVSDAEKRGLIGEKVTLLEVSPSDVFPSKTAQEAYKPMGYSDEHLFTNKTFTITDHYKDVYDFLVIENSSGTYHWAVKSTAKYIFNKLIEDIKGQFIGVKLSPFLMSIETEDFNGEKVSLSGETQYEVTDVKFAKMPGIGTKYGFVIEFDNSLEFRLPADILRYGRTYNGKTWEQSKSLVNIQSSDEFSPRVLMVEINELNNLKSEYSGLLSTARQGKVSVGMDEELVNFAWGGASKTHVNLGGCAKVNVYGNQNLCFDKIGNGKLTRIF